MHLSGRLRKLLALAMPPRFRREQPPYIWRWFCLVSGMATAVFCSSFTFAASANPIVYQGATPVFIDCEAV